MFAFIYRIYLKVSRIIRSAYVNRYVSITSTPPRTLGKIYISSNKVKVGGNVTFYPGVYLWGNEIEIGDNASIGIGTIIHSTNGVHIGNNTVIAGQCYIIDSNHGTKKGELIINQPSEAAPEGLYIGNDVWIGAQCTILKGARIGDGAVIGAGSMVNKDVPPNAVAVGSPCRIIRYRE